VLFHADELASQTMVSGNQFVSAEVLHKILRGCGIEEGRVRVRVTYPQLRGCF